MTEKVYIIAIIAVFLLLLLKFGKGRGTINHKGVDVNARCFFFAQIYGGKLYETDRFDVDRIHKQIKIIERNDKWLN